MRILRNLSSLLMLVLLAGCNVAPNPGFLTFGRVYVGQTSELLTARWANNSNKNVQLLALSTRQPFAIANAGVFANPQGLAPNAESQEVQVTFSPTAAGTFNEEVRPVVLGAPAQYLGLSGDGVWSKNYGAFSLENKPPVIVGSFDFSTNPIQPNQPIDWGTKLLGAPATEAIFQVRNTGPAVNGTAQAKLLNGNKHFRITFPQAHTDFNISAPGGGALATREIRVEFDPSEAGEWMEVIEITDSANAVNVGGIVLKARVVQGE